jgi:hypothetical protein
MRTLSSSETTLTATTIGLIVTGNIATGESGVSSGSRAPSMSGW